MMKQYRDMIGRCVCCADAATGIVEREYKKSKTRTRLPIGGEYTVERDNIITTLTRIDTCDFQVNSYKRAN